MESVLECLPHLRVEEAKEHGHTEALNTEQDGPQNSKDVALDARARSGYEN
jgi:hypothetical protein